MMRPETGVSLPGIEQWRSQGSFFSFRGYDVFWRRQGQGPPLLLLHGFPTASYDWCLVWEALSRRFEVIALDFLGYGFSEKPADFSYSVAFHTDLVEALLADLGVKATGVLAHDYGDTVAQELLARDLEGPRGLRLEYVCLLNGGLFPGVHRPTLILKLLKSPLGFACSALMTEGIFQGRIREIFGPDTQPSPQLLADFWALVNHNRGRRIYHKLIRYMDERWRYRDRWVGALEKTAVPLRLIDGAADPISGEHMAEHYRKTIPRPNVVCLEGIGHYPQLEAPRQVLDAFLE